MTFALFYLMQSLIAGGEGRTEKVVKGIAIDFVRLKRESEFDTKERRLPNKTHLEEEPPPPPIRNSVSKPLHAALNIGDVGFARGLDLIGPDLGAGPADNAPIPLVRVPPLYPTRASARGIEGWVVVEFTITASGAVEDPHVVQGDPPRVFNSAAIRAIRRWKYKPKVVGGKPVAQVGVRTLISFELDE
jgi:protein TonB